MSWILWHEKKVGKRLLISEEICTQSAPNLHPDKKMEIFKATKPLIAGISKLHRPKTPMKKGITVSINRNPLQSLARLAGFEPATYGFVVRHSIQLSYRRIVLSVLLYPKIF